MDVEKLALPGLLLIKPKSFPDMRGFFRETFHQARYEQAGIPTTFVQDNLSFSKKGVIRGMHFQPGQAKLVSVALGLIYDVVVDIRPSSPYFGKWLGVTLDAEKGEQLFIPDGFAHGFCALSDAILSYKVSSLYNSETEQALHFDDPEIAITWPVTNPIISPRDLNAPLLKNIYETLDHRR
ncbi:MAG: dTDP-4-dehydrorhamnose 3,5-epimerase [Verrucomicrobia bacterium]|nr:dTDP-4-dehydrorhamnose 3,5-epimerase [Verrucomicrobiota bacterium]